jgi:HAD superfamily hydrolase (TIGR01459 family)
MTRVLSGLGEVAGAYDSFIVDLWGVMHDGVTPYPGALECLSHLAGKRVLLLSNAPRRAASAQAMLRQLGIRDDLYGHILTSGEATWLALRDRSQPWFARLGNRVYHLGPLRDRNVVDGLGLTLAASPLDADFVVNTGPDDGSTVASDVSAFIPELEACLQANLPMICANPDLVVVRAGMRLLCAGALAEVYARNGGDVFSLGKPDPAIYRMALERLGSVPARVLAIGDSLHTDIAGAANAGLDSLWILGGIHWEETGGSIEAAEDLSKRQNLHPDFVLRHLIW